MCFRVILSGVLGVQKLGKDLTLGKDKTADKIHMGQAVLGKLAASGLQSFSKT